MKNYCSKKQLVNIIKSFSKFDTEWNYSFFLWMWYKLFLSVLLHNIMHLMSMLRIFKRKYLCKTSFSLEIFILFFINFLGPLEGFALSIFFVPLSRWEANFYQIKSEDLRGILPLRYIFVEHRTRVSLVTLLLWPLACFSEPLQFKSNTKHKLLVWVTFFILCKLF